LSLEWVGFLDLEVILQVQNPLAHLVEQASGP